MKRSGVLDDVVPKKSSGKELTIKQPRKGAKKTIKNQGKLRRASVLDDVVPKKSSGRELTFKQDRGLKKRVSRAAFDHSNSRPARTFQQPNKIQFKISFNKNKAIKKERQRRKKLARYHGGPTNLVARAKYRNAVLKNARKRKAPRPKRRKETKLKYDPQERKIWN